MATHSSTLAWKISWTEESGRLQSMGSQSRTRLSNFTFTFHFLCPAIPLVGKHQGKALVQKNTCIPVFIAVAALFTIAKIWKQLKGPSTEEWIKKIWDIYTIKYYSAFKQKKNEMKPFAETCMSQKIIICGK